MSIKGWLGLWWQKWHQLHKTKPDTSNENHTRPDRKWLLCRMLKILTRSPDRDLLRLQKIGKCESWGWMRTADTPSGTTRRPRCEGGMVLPLLLTLTDTAWLGNATWQHSNATSQEPRQNQRTSYKKLECGPMPNVMVALPNIGGALCSTSQSLANAHY